jgi:peptidoglycan DL-endopeptidase CwlO
VLYGRKRLVTAVSGLALAATIGFVPSASADPDDPGSGDGGDDKPTISEVRDRVDRLYHEAEQASERVNDARIELRDLRRELRGLRADERRQGVTTDAARDDLADTIVQQSATGFDSVDRLLTADGTGSLLSDLSTMSSIEQIQDEMLDDYSTELTALTLRRTATERRLEQVKKLKERLADDKQTIDEKADDAEDLLDDLEAEQREALLAGDTSAPTDIPASGRASAVIKYAMAQVGDAYVWGAAGPDAFDCSGFTMMAWAQAGVGLPHSSSAQSGSGASVSREQLQPGDLVFFYSPISHVGIYIGSGMIVHAANPGAGVRVSPLDSMPYSGAVRPG